MEPRPPWGTLSGLIPIRFPSHSRPGHWTSYTDSIQLLQSQNKENNLLKHTNVGIVFGNINILQHLTKLKTGNQTPEHKNGIHKLTCNTCRMSYIGQICRSLKLRVGENAQYIKHNEPQSAYALHVLKNKHEYGPINDTTLLKHIDKPSLLITYEQM